MADAPADTWCTTDLWSRMRWMHALGGLASRAQVLANHEEVPVHAIYRDPIHDFGIFKFDPRWDGKYLTPA